MRHRLIPNLVVAFPSGAGLALLSALLFGASTPLAKVLLRDVDPWMLAGLPYLGSGLGLLAVRTVTRTLGSGTRSEAAIRGGGWMWLALATPSGWVIGPVLLMVGLAHTAATAAALLLNLEGVFTALLAWFVFRENFDRRIALGMAAIVAGGVVLTWGGRLILSAVLGPVMIAGACLAWAIDNNLTRPRRLASSDGAPRARARPRGDDHEHRHVHDQHHQHSHDGTEPPGEPHSHWHTHAGLTHSHPHFPDVHHRHEH